MSKNKGLLMNNDDILTDNTKINYCEQCKNCINWNDKNEPFSNAYDKAFCDIFPYPDDKKPFGVINNTEDCPFFEEK